MSILYSSDDGWVICHNSFIKNVYKDVTNEKNVSFQIKKDLFQINTPFLRYNQNIEKYTSNLKNKRKICAANQKYEQLKNTVSFEAILFISYKSGLFYR